MHSDLYIAQHAKLRTNAEAAEHLDGGTDDIETYVSQQIANMRLDVPEMIEGRPNNGNGNIVGLF